MAVGFRKHAIGWRVRSSAPGGAGTRARTDELMLALSGQAVNAWARLNPACDAGQRVATGGNSGGELKQPGGIHALAEAIVPIDTP